MVITILLGSLVAGAVTATATYTAANVNAKCASKKMENANNEEEAKIIQDECAVKAARNVVITTAITAAVTTAAVATVAAVIGGDADSDTIEDDADNSNDADSDAE